MSVIVIAPVESHKLAIGISISLGKSNFVVYLLIVVFGYCWRAVIAGNTRNMNHTTPIANNISRISENIFQQLREISLTTSQTLKNKAFPAITSQKQTPRPRGTFRH
jgi:hypothetical protein